MSDQVGNVIRLPQFNRGEETTDDEILYSTHKLLQKGMTVKGGQGVLSTGTVVARETASKKYVVYNNSGSGGAEVAAGVLRKGVDTTDGDQLANIVFGGYLKNSKLSGLDANAITDLNGRVDTARDIFSF